MILSFKKAEFQKDLPMFEGSSSSENIEDLIDYLNQLKELGYEKIICHIVGARNEFSAFRSVDKTDAEIIQDLELHLDEEKRIYDALKTKYES